MNNSISMNHLNSCVCNNSYYDEAGTKYCCMGIRPYCCRDLCNQCGNHFCCCNCCCGPIAPTGSMPPIQPTPPNPPIPPIQPLPPMPPIPPQVPGRSFGEFNAVGQILDSGNEYQFLPIDIQGDAVRFDPVTGEIILNGNTTYRYAYATETMLQGQGPSDLEVVLVLNNNQAPGVERSIANNVQPGVLTVLQANGEFVTGPAGGNIISLGLVINPRALADTSATLTIEEV